MQHSKASSRHLISREVDGPGEMVALEDGRVSNETGCIDHLRCGDHVQKDHNQAVSQQASP